MTVGFGLVPAIFASILLDDRKVKLHSICRTSVEYANLSLNAMYPYRNVQGRLGVHTPLSKQRVN